jgi:hypothetical protein
MILAVKRSVALTVAACVIAAGFPRPTRASPTTARGAATAADAAAWRATTGSSDRASRGGVAGGEPLLSLGAVPASYAEPDTAEFDFPDDDRKHLARDITVWVIASAFVAYFLIKVFIEQDDESTPEDQPPGKTIP